MRKRMKTSRRRDKGTPWLCNPEPKKAQPDIQLYAEDRGPGQEVKASRS